MIRNFLDQIFNAKLGKSSKNSEMLEPRWLSWAQYPNKALFNREIALILHSSRVDLGHFKSTRPWPAFDNVKNRKMKSESGFSLAMASQLFCIVVLFSIIILILYFPLKIHLIILL